MNQNQSSQKQDQKKANLWQVKKLQAEIEKAELKLMLVRRMVIEEMARRQFEK